MIIANFSVQMQSLENGGGDAGVQLGKEAVEVKDKENLVTKGKSKKVKNICINYINSE